MKKHVQALKHANAGFLILAAFLIACILELGLFNFSWISGHFGSYQQMELDLSALDGYNGEALPLLPDNPTVSFDNLSIAVRSVTVRTAGPVQAVSGNIGICDEANAYITTGAASFQVNPGGQESVFTARVNSHGNLTRMRITFTSPLTEPVFLLSVVLNEQIPLEVHWLRLLLMTGFLSVLFCALRYRLYEAEYCPDKRTHRLLNLGVLACCLLVSGAILYGGSPDHSYLRAYPSLDELRSPDMVVDAYMQQLDAFEKGQLELDLDVNPELSGLDNPYDKGERDKKGVEYHWDRAYYNGRYYSYFGLAPLFMVYYPVYWATGLLPTELLAATVLAVFAILAIFAAIHGLLKLFRIRANLLLFLIGEAAVVTGSFLYLIQASFTFYYLPLLSAMGWMAAFIALSCFAYEASAASRRILLFGLAGISVVMLVLSRPTAVLLAIAFASPMYLRILFDKNRTVREKLQSAAPFLIPVVIGGAAIMYYNYIRFDSIWEFGTTYQMTESDIRYNHIILNVHHFASMLYHYFMEPFVYGEFFPFLSFTTEKCVDFGNYLYQEYSAGAFQMPLNLGVFLMGFTLCRKSASGNASAPDSLRLSLQKKTYVLLAAGILILGYVNFMLGGIHIRYICDFSLVLSLMAFLLTAEHIQFNQVKSSKILYVIVLFLCLVTIGRGLLTIFSNEKNDIMLANPDFYLWIARMFRF